MEQLRILLVNFETELARLTADILEESNFEVTNAENLETMKHFGKKNFQRNSCRLLQLRSFLSVPDCSAEKAVRQTHHCCCWPCLHKKSRTFSARGGWLHHNTPHSWRTVRKNKIANLDPFPGSTKPAKRPRSVKTPSVVQRRIVWEHRQRPRTCPKSLPLFTRQPHHSHQPQQVVTIIEYQPQQSFTLVQKQIRDGRICLGPGTANDEGGQPHGFYKFERPPYLPRSGLRRFK